MKSLSIAVPLVLGAITATLNWDPLAWLNQRTETVLRRDGLFGERLVDQPYGVAPRQRADVYLPPATWQTPAAGWPMVVFFYGGSWQQGERAEYAFVGRTLSARGMVVVVADYRLHPEVRYPEFLHDSAQALAWAWQQAPVWQVDRRRVFVMGHSAGAYNAAMVAMDPRWLAPHGLQPASLAGFIGLAGPYNFLPLKVPALEPIFLHPQTPADSQPIMHVRASQPPAWLFTAASDDLVSSEVNTLALAERMRQVGAQVTVQAMPWTSHATLLGALAPSLSWLSPVLSAVDRAVHGGAPLSQARAEPQQPDDRWDVAR